MHLRALGLEFEIYYWSFLSLRHLGGGLDDLPRGAGCDKAPNVMLGLRPISSVENGYSYSILSLMTQGAPPLVGAPMCISGY